MKDPDPVTSERYLFRNTSFIVRNVENTDVLTEIQSSIYIQYLRYSFP